MKELSETKESDWDRLIKAIETGSRWQVLSVLTMDPILVNKQDVEGFTVLHVAAANGHMEIVEMLLLHKYNLINIIDNEGNTILHSAAANGYGKIVEAVLLRTNLKIISLANKNDETLFYLAVKNNQNEIIELLQSKVSFDEIINSFITCRENYIEEISKIICDYTKSLLVFLNRDIAGMVYEYIIDSTTLPPSLILQYRDEVLLHYSNSASIVSLNILNESKNNDGLNNML